jgi:hypothetical protein
MVRQGSMKTASPHRRRMHLDQSSEALGQVHLTITLSPPIQARGGCGTHLVRQVMVLKLCRRPVKPKVSCDARQMWRACQIQVVHY